MKNVFLLLLLSTLLLGIYCQNKKNSRETAPKSILHKDIQKYIGTFARPFLSLQESIQKKILYVYNQFDKAWTVLNGKRLKPARFERTSAQRNKTPLAQKSNRKQFNSHEKNTNRLSEKAGVTLIPDSRISESNNFTGDNKRALQTPSCINGGKQVTTSITTYKCNGTYVNQAVYNNNLQNNPNSNCSSYSQTLVDVCFCPADSYGIYCENQNMLTCNTQLLSPQTNCQGPDSDTFVYEYGGMPPCVNVSLGDNVPFEISTTCSNEYPNLLQEGITYGIPFTYNNKPNITFNYAINTTDLVSIDVPNIQTVIKFIDWGYISNLTNFSYPIPPQYIINGTTQTIQVPVISDIIAKAYGGRIFYEIDVVYQGQHVNQQLQMGFFDLKGYQEPPYVFHLSPGDITGIVIGTLCVVIFVPGLVAYFLSKRKKARVEAREILEREANLITSPNLPFSSR